MEDNHSDFLVINKPAGLAVHKDGRNLDEFTLSDYLIHNYPELKTVGETQVLSANLIIRPGIVHRLDKDTSGLILVAKNQPAFLGFKEMFKQQLVKKTYYAVVYGIPKLSYGTIDAPIGRSPKDFRRWSAQPGARGHLREAVTNWELIKSFSDKGGESFSLLKVKPLTGRTHQIRVHLKYLNHPIVGDRLYSGKRKPALGFLRQALHAGQIDFSWQKRDFSYLATWPSDFQRLIDGLKLDKVLEKKPQSVIVQPLGLVK